MADKELRETVRAAFACYDEDGSGWIDVRELRHVVADLGGVFTERDFRQALRLLDRDSNGVIDQNEFTEWWMGQTTSESAVGQVEKTLARLKDLGRQRFRVDIHSACWNGSEDVVTRLVEGDTQLVNEKDAAEFGNSNSPLHYAAYQGNLSICGVLLKNGASVNATNGSGCTPVFFASQQAHVVVVELLLQNGADLRIAENKHGLTPVDVCTTQAIYELFRDLSGKPPGTPAPPVLETSSDTELKIQWSPPPTQLDEVVPVSGYKIALASASAPSKVVLTVAFPTETSIAGLCADTEYIAAIAAINLHGVSAFSAGSQPATTRKAKPSTPSLIVSHTNLTSISLAWELAASDRQSGTHCVIYQSEPEPDGTCVWQSVRRIEDHSITSTVVENLLPDHRYKFRVAVIGNDGQQTLSAAVAARTTSKAVTLRSVADKFSTENSVAKAFASRSEAKDCKEDAE